MITLFGGGANFGLPEVSPYVMKTEVQLQMAGVAYRKERATPQQSPKGQIPFIDDDGALIADSTFIRAYIERKFGFDLDDGLSPAERAQSWAIERMIENHFNWVATAYSRWIIPENFAKGPSHFFDGAPNEDALREEVLGRVHASLKAVGIGRHSPDEITALGDRSLLALSELLGGKRYFMGDRPTGLDGTAFGALAALLTPYFDSPLRRRALAYPNLLAYVDRMMLQYFPQHPWAPLAGFREDVKKVL